MRDMVNKVLKWLLLIVILTWQLYAGVPVHFLHLGSSNIDLSTRNEVEFALDRAAQWFINTQAENGSWGVESNAVKLTSVAAMALTSINHSAYLQARDKAIIWLSNSGKHSVPELEVHAWRLLALALAVPKSAERQALFAGLVQEAEKMVTLGGVNKKDLDIWQQCVGLSGLEKSTTKPETDNKEKQINLPANWPANIAGTYELWQVVKKIAINTKLEVLCNNQVFNWRKAVAEHLINTQRRNIQGGACWHKNNQPDLWESAWAVILLGYL